jgi:hypothetical protein
LNAAAVKAVYPSIDAGALAEAFKQYVSLTQDLQIDRIDIAPNRHSATVTGSITNAPVVTTGKATPQRRSATFRLRKSGDSWLIQEVRLN